jgi:hypothetical protein
MPRVGFEPTIPAFERFEDGSCLRPRGHSDRHITPCSPLKFNEPFTGVCRLHLKDRKNRRERNQQWLCSSPAFMLVYSWSYPSTLKMEAKWSSKTSVEFQRTTRRYIPEHIRHNTKWTQSHPTNNNNNNNNKNISQKTGLFRCFTACRILPCVSCLFEVAQRNCFLRKLQTSL